MLPAVRLYWFIALFATPVSLAALLLGAGSFNYADLSAQPANLVLCVVLVAYTLLGFYEHFLPSTT